MKLSELATRRYICLGVPLLVAVLATEPVAPSRADTTPLAGAPSEARVTALTMRWFTEIQAGRTDRSLYAPAFAPQVTDEAVRAMSQALNKYGAPPLRAEVVQTGKGGEQTFYTIKFVFPRGDATSLLFGFDADGKITGIAVGGMAGD
jgi:hypothetical protein